MHSMKLLMLCNQYDDMLCQSTEIMLAEYLPRILSAPGYSVKSHELRMHLLVMSSTVRFPPPSRSASSTLVLWCHVTMTGSYQ